MTDTIELLEAIGSDASLRYAPADELKGVLEQVQASVELTMAVVAGDGAPLRDELGLHQAPQTPQAPTHDPGHGDDDEDDEGVVHQPERRQPGHTPPHPHKRDSSH
ncbi:hypothetical protein [Rhodanobacter sp. DHB23]|uniref:hypothetical protein n=1 Tax=Rhodanobacter sp. DHB23 TaxID=2775923 RepID=UPI0017806CD3|nr:hypothetical protein [Rhodanobacter sp. DHB23]MBD8871732.1 hypothetical protein [Rhodanobacter sp. DHB23]